MKLLPLPAVLVLAVLVFLPACRSASNARAPEPVDTSAAAARMDDGGCPSTWLAPPAVDPSIALPAGGALLVHALGVGTQNYACKASPDGGTAWALTGPAADLRDCHGAVIGHHFAGDGGAATPEWQTTDGTYVVGHKVAAFSAGSGAASVPSLLLKVTGHGGSGTLGQTAYVQRLDADGGVASRPCQPGDTADVPYTADYYFYGP
jgi:hypothetical protein